VDVRRFVTEYLMLGLRFDRVAKGFVDAYTGEPELRRRVLAEGAPDPAALAVRAAVLRAELANTSLPEPRRRFLRAQLTALECSGRRLAGEPVPFVAEVEECFQVPIRFGDQDVYRRAHAELDELLPGRGNLAERLHATRIRERVPACHLERCVLALSTALRQRVRSQISLPPRESVEYRIVTDRPWSGFHCYAGEFHSQVAVNGDLGHRFGTLPRLVAHESYPGHHTEHCRRELVPVNRWGHREQSISLVNTPRCVISEGLADLGLEVAVGPRWGRWATDVYADLGLTAQGEVAERVDSHVRVLLAVRQDAALMLHDRGADESEVRQYLRRWLLMSDKQARAFVRFLADPMWRAYTTTYVEGERLLRAWFAARPEGTSQVEQYRRLLDEPCVPAGLRAELAGWRATATGGEGVEVS
jgi:hypothetical protein